MVQIVFITGCSEYIAEGCEVAALHYLMKPVKEDKLYAVLERALEKRKQDERFCRVGRAMILNLRYVRRVTRSEVHLFDGTALPLPRGACEPLNRAIIAPYT